LRNPGDLVSFIKCNRDVAGILIDFVYAYAAYWNCVLFCSLE